MTKPFYKCVAFGVAVTLIHVINDASEALGKCMKSFVAVAEIARRRFLKDLQIGKISIGTAEMPPREVKTRQGWFQRWK